MDTHIWTAESLCCAPETGNIVNWLYSNLKKLKKKQKQNSGSLSQTWLTERGWNFGKRRVRGRVSRYLRHPGNDGILCGMQQQLICYLSWEVKATCVIWKWEIQLWESGLTGSHYLLPARPAKVMSLGSVLSAKGGERTPPKSQRWKC